MERRYIFGLVGIGLLMAAAVGAAVWWLGPERLIEAGGLTSDISKATLDARVKGPYEPSSEYIEPGLDPGVTNLAMGGGQQAAGENLPEMLSPGAIQRVMNERQQELVRCYATGLEENPELAGRVYFDFGVAPDGHVALVRVTRSKLRSKATEDCFVDRAREWTFPATRREVLTRFDTDFNFVTQ